MERSELVTHLFAKVEEFTLDPNNYKDCKTHGEAEQKFKEWLWGTEPNG